MHCLTQIGTANVLFCPLLHFSPTYDDDDDVEDEGVKDENVEDDGAGAK